MSDSALNKQIHELDALNKITGKEEMLIDNGEYSFRVTVDSLLGYIAKQINAGTLPEEMLNSTSIEEIPEGEELPASARKEGNYYLRVCSHSDAKHNAGLSNNIVVSPNMGLRIISD